MLGLLTKTSSVLYVVYIMCWEKVGTVERSKFLKLAISISIAFLVLIPTSCSNTDTVDEKVSSQLLTQVKLRKEQIADPTLERLEIMKNMGMRVDNLGSQRTFIHLSQELNTSQIKELEGLGVTLYLDSWIPPVGGHQTGFLIADMPVDKLNDLAEKDYVVRLDTAERQSEPQSNSQPQSE